MIRQSLICSLTGINKHEGCQRKKFRNKLKKLKNPRSHPKNSKRNCVTVNNRQLFEVLLP